LGNAGQVPRKAFHSAMLGQETRLAKNLHRIGTTLCIIVETVEGLTSKINAKVSMHGYFLIHINVNNTLLTLLSLHPLVLSLLLPLLFNRAKSLDILKVMSNKVSQG
jgi:hypothetical protein